MKYLLFFLAAFLILFISEFGIWSNLAIILWLWYVIQLFFMSNKTIAFREFLLTLYGLNYLLAPALSYHQEQAVYSAYKMRIPEADYFAMAIPGMIALQLGLYALKTKIFEANFASPKMLSSISESVLIKWLFFGVFCFLLNPFLPGELSFLVYLVSGIRYVAAFGLFSINRKKYLWHLVILFVLEFMVSLSQSMFHDFIMWLIFFGIYYSYLTRMSPAKKIVLATFALFSFFLLQVTKSDYRDRTWRAGEVGGFSTFEEVASKNFDKGLFTQSNLTGSLSRVNQAWIFSSTVNNMNYTQDFQGLSIVELYVESAILPRFLAPNKLTAGNKDLFNKFSGHTITSGTSMGLGIFADGYIAYGMYGVMIFAFALGLIFSLVFKVVEGWMGITPVFMLFIFPILNYAVRPDCETQTIIGHLVKGLIVFGSIMYFYRKYFQKKLALLKRGHTRRNTAVLEG